MFAWFMAMNLAENSRFSWTFRNENSLCIWISLQATYFVCQEVNPGEFMHLFPKNSTLRQTLRWLHFPIKLNLYKFLCVWVCFRFAYFKLEQPIHTHTYEKISTLFCGCWNSTIANSKSSSHNFCVVLKTQFQFNRKNE